MTKICENCGMEMEDSVKYCTNCKCERFRNKNEIGPQKSSLVHKLFYTNYDGYYIMSKSKIAAISVFLIFMQMGFVPPFSAAVFVVSAIIAVLVYIICFSIRRIIGKPSQVKIRNNDYGFFTDLKHLLFYWQTKEGGFVLSKSKVIAHLVFLLFFTVAVTNPAIYIFSAVFVGAFFEMITFAIGFIIHKLTNPNPQAKPEIKKAEPKKEIEKPITPPKIESKNVIPEYAEYKRQIDDLNLKFQSKDKSARDLIEKRFEPPQLTYTRFITGVDKSKELFNRNMDSALTMIDLADEYSPRIAGEIESRIDILKAIISKLDSLSNELVLKENLSKKEDVDNLIDEMDVLIKSVKDYNE